MLYALTVTISAFLIFQVQPVIGKYILPWFGGTPNVWATTLLFFQFGLLIGYTYAHLIVKYFDTKKQVLIHIGLIILTMTLLPITPSDAYKPEGSEDPFFNILSLLFLTVGAPYIFISATGPLLQKWYSRRYVNKSPYRLYALSNVGSLFGLLSYPFLIEPVLKLETQTWLWSASYVIYIIACGLAGYNIYRYESNHKQSAINDKPQAVEYKNSDFENTEVNLFSIFMWVSLSACGSLFLMASTNKITQDIAPIPFLWVIPLALYLITFIICFDSPRWYKRYIWIPLFIFSIPALIYGLSDGKHWSIANLILVFSLGMFSLCMVCHGELTRLKPKPENLTTFYLLVSLGGVIGGLFVSFFAPRFFNGLWEFHIGIILALTLVGISLLIANKKINRLYLVIASSFWVSGTVTAGVYLNNDTTKNSKRSIETRRNFYGVIRITDRYSGTKKHYRKMMHGNIKHGLEFRSKKLRNYPTSYYSRKSGIGLSLERHPRKLDGKGIKVGILGLGVGTLAYYSDEKDHYRFYEINKVVTYMAQKHFTFMKSAKGKTEILMGDGRITMEKELKQNGSLNYDVLAIDAFSGDAVPMHLLTKEAFELYFKHLKKDGILAIHVSNRYLRLDNVVYGIAAKLNKKIMYIKTRKNRRRRIGKSRWILITDNDAFRNNRKVTKYLTKRPITLEKVLWTDDFSNLARVLK